jgi:serine/threonine-protein kinase
MGVVYEGRDPNLDRRVAIKTVKVENLSEEAAAEYEHRFRTEARSAARLQHPNIVSVYDSDRDGDVAFLVMEYIQGDDLKHHLDRGVRYSLEQSLKIIRDLLSALDYAHKQGIVHRDIKPANLLIEPGGRVKLTDFGVARIQDSGEATRTQGSMVGTLKYMAPEQVQGQKIDSRADLFSVGVVLYQLLTDKRPFDGDNDFSIIHQIIGHNPPPPSSVNARLPSALDAVVARALAKTREDRFATARDFAVALQAAIRRAEDQTVVPPQNPNKKVEAGASRPLTAPGTAPGGATQPSVGSVSSVTQELELVYWKDVKDSTDPEELQEFLHKFPAGIYADLARRRLRRLSGDPTNTFSASMPGALLPDPEATRMRDPSTPAMRTQDLRPAQWIDEEYTKTLVQTGEAPRAAPAAPALVPAASPAVMAAGEAALAAAAASGAAAITESTMTQPAESEFAATQPVVVPPAVVTQPPAIAPAPAPAAPVRPPAVAAKPAQADEDDAPPVNRKKLPIAVIAGVAVLGIAGVLALVMGRSGPAPDAPAGAAPVAAAPVAAPAPAPAPVAVAPVPPPATIPVAASAAPPAAAAPGVPPNPNVVAKADPVQSVKKPAPPPRPVAKASAPVTTPEPQRPVAAAPAPRADPEPAPASSRPVAAAPSANAANLAAVDDCKDRVFLSREICLKENCAKSGTRNHPLCVKHREEVRLREESKQLPQNR